MTISREIRNLAKEYYMFHGEKVRVTDKIVRNGLCNQPEYAYVCRLTDQKGNSIWSVIDADNYDAHGNRYILELYADENKDVAMDCWLLEFESDDYYDEEWEVAEA